MSDNPLELVLLHTGVQVPEATAVSTWITLRGILANDPLAFADVADWVHKPGHVMSDETLDALPPGWRMGESVSKDTLHVLRASISGPADDMELRLLNPFTG